MASFVGRVNQYIQLAKILYCKLPTIGKQLPTFSHKVQDLNHWPQRWEVSVSPLHSHAPIGMYCSDLFLSCHDIWKCTLASHPPSSVVMSQYTRRLNEPFLSFML